VTDLAARNDLDGGPIREAPGCMLKRNPGVAMIWMTRNYEIVRVPRNNDTGAPPGVLCIMGEPTRVEWYREARIATRTEVQESIDTGLPALVAAAAAQPGGLEMFQRQEKHFQKYLPAE
jgi:hypothetical protein